MAGINDSVTQNLLPVQAYFDLQGNFQTFIGQNQPFYATVNPSQSGLNITNSTIDSTIIGANSPSTGVFTNITTTTGSILSIPTGSLNIVNKGYVDAVATGLNPKSPAAVLAYNNITLSGLQTIDGYTTLSGDRVLVIGQTNAANNGIYAASSGSWTRTSDANTWALLYGAYVFIDYGTVYAGSAWVNTSPSSGTLGTTPITFVQFANSATYTAGTGLSLSAYQFSIANTGVTSGSFGSASNTLLATVNAQGQLTSLSATPIAITNTQVSGLGTMSTQNGNNVEITGGTVNGTIIGNSTAAAITGTTITATSSFSGSGSGLTGTASGLSIGGSAASATTAGSVTNSLTFDNTGSGAVSGTTFNGSSAKTISYNTIGAPSTTGTNASGTWAINVSGNAATVTNGVYTTGSYSNPAWITSILGSIVSGAVASATTATNVAGGTTGSLLYQSAASTTANLALGTSGYVLTAGSTAPQYVAQSTLSVGSASTATTSTNIANGVAGAIPYQSDVSTTGFTAAGTSGQVLTSAGTGTPTWTTPTSYATVTDDTTTNGTRYPLFANQTSGNLSTEYTSSTKLQYNPNTGLFTATGFSGSGASLTSLTAGNLTGTIPSAVLGNSSLYIGTTAILLNAASGSITSLAVNISGSAGSATTATTATNATNIAITDNTSSSSTYYPILSVATTGNNPATTSSTQLSFVPSTGALTATLLNSSGGALNGTIGGTTPAAGTFTTITGQTEVLKGTGANLFTQSSSLTNASWTAGAITVTGSQSDPFGGTTAALLNDGTTTALHQITQAVTTDVGAPYTISIYAKAGTANYFGVYHNTQGVFFNLTTGAFTGNIIAAPVSYASVNVGSGWWRLSIVVNPTSNASAIQYIMSEDGTSYNYLGTSKTVYVCAPQLEIGSTLNTYISTTTTAVYGTPTLSFSGVAGLGLQSDGSLYVSPAGTGALQAQATTSSTVGGNARGANAVDWQTLRDAATKVASGAQSVLGGGSYNVVSGGTSVVVGGSGNNNSGSGSVIVGGTSNTNSSSNNGVVGGGYQNSLSSNGQWGFVGGGYTNTAAGFYNFIGTGYTNSGTSGSAVTTQSATMNATTTVTLAATNANIKVGQLITGTSITTFPATYVAAISGTSLTLSQNASGSSTSTLSFYTPHGVVVGGGNNQATGAYSFIGGGGDAGTAANRNVASGDWSVVCGGRQNTASGVGAFVGGGGVYSSPFSNNNYPNSATAVWSAVVAGGSNNALAEGAFVGAGTNNSANANYTTLAGGAYGTARSIVGNTVFSACQYPIAGSQGISQAALLVLAVQTTDATATVLRSNTGAASGTNQVILPNNSAYYFKGEIISGVTGGGDSKGWEISGVIKRGAGVGTTTLVGSTVTSLYADAGAATWTIALAADTTNGGLKVTFTGQASTTIRTVAQICTTEMTY